MGVAYVGGYEQQFWAVCLEGDRGGSYEGRCRVEQAYAGLLRALFDRPERLVVVCLLAESVYSAVVASLL
jgi:hypothetical protein